MDSAMAIDLITNCREYLPRRVMDAKEITKCLSDEPGWFSVFV
jgi:hypothetical protein